MAGFSRADAMMAGSATRLASAGNPNASVDLGSEMENMAQASVQAAASAKAAHAVSDTIGQFISILA